jgi:type II secretory pathway pseudopilin PulG
VPSLERSQPEAGFTLRGFSVAVLLLGGLAAVAVPAYRRHLFLARRDEAVRQLQTLAGAFQSYAKDHGDWPAAGLPPKAVPPGMARYLTNTPWQQPTPLGGSYEWVTATPQNGGRYAAAILITDSDRAKVSSDRELLQEIDRVLDDGDLSSGKFFLGYRGLPVYVLEH